MQGVQRLSKILPDSGPDDVCDGLVPTDAGPQAVDFQAQKGFDSHANMVPLGFRFPRLALLHTAALLQSPVIVLYAPSLVLQSVLFLRGHAKPLVAQCSTSPFGESVRNTLTNP